jgi:rod shape-determining protein MreC
MLKRAYDLLIQFKEYALLALYLLIALVLFAQNTTYQVKGIRSNLLAAAGFLQDTFDFIPNYFALARENRILREQNILLSDEVNTLRESAIENIRLRAMYGLKERPAFSYVSALVVGTQMQALTNTVTINAGTENGIRNGMPVVTDHGLAGRVTSTSGHYAIVQLLLHKDLRVSARTQRSRVNGIIRWTGGSELRMINVPKTSDVGPGDVASASAWSLQPAMCQAISSRRSW